MGESYTSPSVKVFVSALSDISAKYNANDEPYWEATLHQAVTCCYPEGGYLMEVQLHKVTSILP